VRESITAETGLATSVVRPDQELKDIGVDSILALSIRLRLERALGAKLPAALLLADPMNTVQTVATRLVGLLDRPGAGRHEAERDSRDHD
jgi:epothilone polyketide synthase D